MRTNVTIVIPTINRAIKLEKCLRSILRSGYEDYCVKVIDQSSDNQSKNVVEKLNDKRIHYIFTRSRGASKARNLGVSISHSKYIIFVDDDIYVTKSFIRNYVNSFLSNPKAGIVCGRVGPLMSSRKLNQTCLSTTEFTKKKIFRNVFKKKVFTFKTNSMAIKKDVFVSLGGFKEWLGAGSIGFGAEDEEFAYRALKNGVNILIDPTITSAHDHWVDMNDFEIYQRNCSYGFFTAFSYHAFLGDKVALKYLINELYNKYLKQFVELRRALIGLRPKIFYRTLVNILVEIIVSYRDYQGIAVGMFYAIFVKKSK